MALNRVIVDLYIYKGIADSYSSEDKKYTIQRERISNRSNILIEIAELVRDYISSDFNNNYQNSSSTVWVTVSISYYDENDDPISQTETPVTYLAFDGYGEFEDGINPQLSTGALMTKSTIYLPEGTVGKIPIFAEGVGKYIIGGATTQVTDNGNSNQKIQYINVPADTTNDVVIYATDV